MTPEERSRAAEAVLSILFFYDLMKEFEDAAINAVLAAKYDDHEARQAHAADARAVRKLRSRLEAISKEGHAQPARKAPA